MTGEDSTDEGESGLSRREMLGATALLGGASVLGTGTAGAETSVNGGARADMQTSNEPRIALGDDYAIDDSPDGNGDFVIEHLPSGAELRYDSAADSWTAGSVSVGDATINKSVTGPLGGVIDDALLAHSAADKRVESGVATHADPGSASGSGWDTFQEDLTSVTFGTAFSASPVVALGGTTGKQGLHEAGNYSTTGFDSRWVVYHPSSSSGQDTHWVAVGDD